ncbi:MAG: hypothetical protein ACE5GD_04840 [Candidatus Geothermarchaeales archaeon]
MPLVCKIFKLMESLDLGLIAQKLKDFKKVEEIEAGREIKLLTEVKDLSLEEDALKGVFSEDFMMSIYYRGEPTETPVTRETPILFKRHDDAIILIVQGKKLVANNIANRLSEILFIRTGGIVEAKISHETLKSLHEASPEATKVIFFDDVDFPNVNRMALYGWALANTTLYNEYLDHGHVWYVVFESKKYGYVVGITRHCVVTMFSRAEQKEFLTFVLEEVLPLIT